MKTHTHFPFPLPVSHIPAKSGSWHLTWKAAGPGNIVPLPAPLPAGLLACAGSASPCGSLPSQRQAWHSGPHPGGAAPHTGRRAAPSQTRADRTTRDGRAQTRPQVSGPQSCDATYTQCSSCLPLPPWAPPAGCSHPAPTLSPFPILLHRLKEEMCQGREEPRISKIRGWMEFRRPQLLAS